MILKESKNLNSIKDPFSLTTTGVSYYNDFLNPKEKDYLSREKNLKGEVIWMSPEEYLKECARIFNSSYITQLKAGSDESSLESFDRIISEGKKLWMPYLNYTNNGQEGRHRAVWALKNNIKKMPVLVVNYADEQRAKDEAEEERAFRIRNRIERIFDNFRRYNYSFRNLSTLKDDLSYSIDRAFSEKNKPFNFYVDNNGVQITIDGVDVTIPKEDINVINWEWEEEDDFFDYDDLE